MSIAEELSARIEQIIAAHPDDLDTVMFEVRAAGLDVGELLGASLVRAVHDWYRTEVEPLRHVGTELGLYFELELPNVAQVFRSAADQIETSG